jgi:hypothetical protein
MNNLIDETSANPGYHLWKNLVEYYFDDVFITYSTNDKPRHHSVDDIILPFKIFENFDEHVIFTDPDTNEAYRHYESFRNATDWQWPNQKDIVSTFIKQWSKWRFDLSKKRK